MKNLIIFNVGIVLIIIVPIILLMLQCTEYVFKYVDYFTDDSYCAIGITSFQELIDTIIYILGILSWIAAAAVIFAELYMAFTSVFVSHNQIISYANAMSSFAVCLSVISFEIIVASINLIGAFIWHQSYDSSVNESRR